MRLRRAYRGIEKEADSQSGYSLPELMIAAAILILTISGILISYIRCMELNDISKNMTIAVEGAKSKMEDIRNTDFTQIAANYHDVSFNIAGLNGMGVSYVDSTIPQLLTVTVSVSFRLTNGRVIGDDKDIDGNIDAGEDPDGDGMLNSTVQMVSNVVQR